MPKRRRGEFETIAELFRPLTMGDPDALELADDAARLVPRAGYEIVVTADQLIEGVHTLGTEPADLVAKKALRRNLSDLIAKGANFRGYFMTLALPRKTTDAWLELFCRGLAEDGRLFGIPLLGGDTATTKGPLVVSITALGEVPEGRMLRRSGARAGMDLYATGTIGDAAFGLDALQGRIPRNATFEARYFLPEPRMAFVTHAARFAKAAIDISDGFMADLGHMCRASGVAAIVRPSSLPVSGALRRALKDGAPVERALTGGDDYEVLFAAETRVQTTLRRMAQRGGLPVTRVGKFVEGEPGRIEMRDMPGLSARPGFTHF
ncbi:MAG: thiamine-phosphate kinase [Tagaea sp.]|nr:thiamine-phosphate kinase [Tagaea sp.]